MGEVRHDTKIMGDIYRLLWKRDVNTHAGCEEAAATIATYLSNKGLAEERLWSERPDLLSLQNVIYPFKTTKMKVLDKSLVAVAEGMLKFTHRQNNGERSEVVRTALRIANRAAELFEDDRYVIVSILVFAIVPGGHIKNHHVRMTFGAEIANALDAFALGENTTTKDYMDKIVQNDIAAAVKALYLQDELESGAPEIIGERTIEEIMYQVGRLRHEFSVEIESLLREGFDDGDAT